CPRVNGYTSQAALSGGNLPSTNGALVSTGSPSGNAIGCLPAFSAHTRPPERRNITASGGAGRKTRSPSNSERALRNSSTCRKKDNSESASASCFSTVSAAQSAGIGNQVSADAENPNGGVSPDHGMGTRHLSRPRSVCPERSQVGSCSTSSGRSNTSGK